MSSADGELRTVTVRADEVRKGDRVHNGLASRVERASGSNEVCWVTVTDVDYDYGAFSAVQIITVEWKTDQHSSMPVEVQRVCHPIPDVKLPPEIYQCLRINVPNWFKQLDFVEWLNNGCNSAHCNRRLWTWHTGGEPNEFSDICVTYDEGDGSDSDMPPWAWDEICAECEKRGITFALVWMSNLDG